MTVDQDALLHRIRDKEAKVGIIGLGYVGLPLALVFVDRGFQVVGFDVDPKKIKALDAGECYIKHLDQAWVSRNLETGRFASTTNFDELANVDAILICVPTPLTPQREPDMRYVLSTAREIGPRLRPGQLVVLESTTYPGTTDELLRSALEEASGLVAGKDFFLAFSPEREDPGNPNYSTSTIPKVVGGIDEVSGDLADALYAAAVAKTVRVSSARAAEATKLLENIFRAVNIALVNELKVVYDEMGIDVWEVLDAASTKPFGFMRFNPGPGWGGHCIPLDPFYLSWKAREYGVPPKFIELAGEINVEMPKYVVGKLQRALNDHGKSVRNAKVLLLG
ncbi:MAG: nucleotide sugar dehydrogenase, partial [Myxococcota bacterium]